MLSWKKKPQFVFDKNHETSKKYFLQKNHLFFAPILEQQQGLRKKTQRNILGLVHKLQKDLLFLERILDQLSIQKLNLSQKSCQKLNRQLTTEYQTKKAFLEKIEKGSLFCFQEEEKKKETLSFLSFCLDPFATTLFHQKINKE